MPPAGRANPPIDHRTSTMLVFTPGYIDMTKSLPITAFIACLASGASAQDSGQGQSIMFQDQGQNRDYLTTLPESQKQKSLGDRCMEMAREAERLKGKPQRRSAMMDRYRRECELR